MKYVVAAVALASGTAAADPERFVTIDRQDDSSSAGAEVSLLAARGGTSGAPTNRPTRFDLHGQLVDADRGIGAYVSLPVAYVSGDAKMFDVEVGGIYAVRLANNAKIILHAGITLPTSHDESDFLATVAAGSRLSDHFQTVPHGTSLRLAASPIVRKGDLFARADAGIDINASSSIAEDAPRRSGNELRLQAGGGIDFGAVALMLENTTLYDTSLTDHILDAAALSLRADIGGVSPYAAVVVDLTPGTASYAAVTLGLELH